MIRHDARYEPFPSTAPPRVAAVIVGLLASLTLAPGLSAAEPTDDPGQASVFLTPVDLTVNRVLVSSDNGDDDGWADDRETVTLRVELSNKSGFDLSGLTLRLLSDDPHVACVSRPFLFFGDLADGATRISQDEFEFVVGDVDRTHEGQLLDATFGITIDGNDLQGSVAAQDVTIDLDLNTARGGGPTRWSESFEAGLGAFVPMPLDDELNPPDEDLGNYIAGLVNAEGYRCQNHDPDISCGFDCIRADCFPNPNGAPDAFWWSVTTERAFDGSAALYFGSYLDELLGYTTPTAQLEAVRTAEPINLGWERVCELDRSISCTTSLDCPDDPVQDCVEVTPTLAFKHQISLIDYRTIAAPDRASADRAVVAVQLADDDGSPIGDWIKIQPYVNVYDSQPVTYYTNCTFDPIDDGNDEDDLYEDSPTGLDRRGPSSTCGSEAVFAHQGDTEHFDATRIGGASDGPGLRGQVGPGTWVEPLFDLSRFRGRRLRLRFLTSGMKLGSLVTWEEPFEFNPDPRDDGWFIDDVVVTDTLVAPANVTVDLNPNVGMPGCELTCSQVEAAVDATPPSSPVPGQAVTLDANDSSADRCVGGSLLYRFWVDADRDGRIQPGTDFMFRDWTDNPRYTDAPAGSLQYVVEVRCATDPTCGDLVMLDYEVDCPIGSGGLQDWPSENLFLESAPEELRSVRFGPDKSTLVWPMEATVDVVRGDLDALRSTATFESSVELCLADDAFRSRSLEDSDLPLEGSGFYYLGRSAGRCNAKAGGSWATASDGESPGRDAGIDASPAACAGELN